VHLYQYLQLFSRPHGDILRNKNFKTIYGNTQYQNPRTLSVLAAAFGPDLAARYMDEVMSG
jgi:hypothetical protein